MINIPLLPRLLRGNARIYLVKSAGQLPRLIRGVPQGWVAWKVLVPRWALVAVLGIPVWLITISAVVVGVAHFRPGIFGSRVQASSPGYELGDRVRSNYDAAREAAFAGNAALASEDIAAATRVLREGLNLGVRAPDDLFDRLQGSLDGIRQFPMDHVFVRAYLDSEIALAEYRSALTAIPQMPDRRLRVDETWPLASKMHIRAGDLAAPVMDASGLHKNMQIFQAPPSALFADGVWVEGVGVLGGSQTLDGIHWRDVTFVGSHIRYTGGEIELRNVRFVHCTFEITSDARSATEFGQAAAMQRETFVHD